jgi:hypothetical protein
MGVAILDVDKTVDESFFLPLTLAICLLRSQLKYPQVDLKGRTHSESGIRLLALALPNVLPHTKRDSKRECCGGKVIMSPLSKVEMCSCEPQALGMQEGLLLMTQADRDRLVTLRKAKKRLITHREAAEGMGLSIRQVKRFVVRVEKARGRGRDLRAERP